MPIFISFLGTNNAAPNFVHLLQQNNLMLSEENATSCEFLQQTIGAWLDVGANVQTQVPQYNVTEYVLWAQLLPVRCPFQRQNLSEGVITNCTNGTSFPKNVCDVWDLAPSDPLDATPEYYADLLNIRVGGISEYVETNTDLLTNTTFSVRLLVNENHAISFVYVVLDEYAVFIKGIGCLPLNHSFLPSLKQICGRVFAAFSNVDSSPIWLGCVAF
jgi:hypothetical protein